MVSEGPVSRIEEDNTLGEGYCTDTIIGTAEAILIWVIVISALGVLLHMLLTRRMSFMDFNKDEDIDTTRIKEMIRLLLPFAAVILFCMLLPLIYYKFSLDLLGCLHDSQAVQFVKFPWNVLVPTREWSLTLLMDAGLGAMFYWLFGGVCWLATK